MSRKEPPVLPCYACGDLGDKRFDGKPVCNECYDELANGKIVIQNVNFFGGDGRADDDSGPWQQNAIRELEDRGGYAT